MVMKFTPEVIKMKPSDLTGDLKYKDKGHEVTIPANQADITGHSINIEGLKLYTRTLSNGDVMLELELASATSLKHSFSKPDSLHMTIGKLKDTNSLTEAQKTLIEILTSKRYLQGGQFDATTGRLRPRGLLQENIAFRTYAWGGKTRVIFDDLQDIGLSLGQKMQAHGGTLNDRPMHYTHTH